MPSLRFNHVFSFLLGLSLLSAFVFPRHLTDRLRPQIQKIFTPVAQPTRALASRIMGRPDIPHTSELGLSQAEQIQRLEIAVASLTQQLNDLQIVNNDRQMLGDVRRLCTPAAVIGTDSGSANSMLNITLGGLREGMPVLYSGGIAGRVEQAGVGGARVLLVTGMRFRVEAAFGRFVENKQGQIEFARVTGLHPLVEGMGNGQMASRGLELKQVKATVQVNDWVILEDPQWPVALQGYKLGRVESIGPRRENALFADIRIRPTGNLTALREVMVMTKQ